MRARQIIDRSFPLYGPDTMKAVYRAFDEAWATIAPPVDADPQVVDETRIKLAEAVLAVTGHDSTNVDQIKRLALQIMDIEKKSAKARAARDPGHAMREPNEDGRPQPPSRTPRARRRALLRWR